MTQTNPTDQDAIEVPGVTAMLKSYDVLNGKWANSSSLLSLNFDLSKYEWTTQVIDNVAYKFPSFLTVTKATAGHRVVAQSSSSKEFCQNLTTTASISGEYDGFQGTLHSNFSNSVSQSSDFSLCLYQYNYAKWSFVVSDYIDLRDYLIDTVKTDIDGTGATPMSAQDVIKTYGTHFLTSGIFGGKIEIAASTFTQTSSNTTDMGTELEASYGLLTKGTATVNIQDTTTSTDSNFTLTSNVYGGTPSLVQPSINNLAPANLSAWDASIEDTMELIDFHDNTVGRQSLTGIWELASTTARQTEIQQAYQDYMSQNALPDNVSFQIIDYYQHGTYANGHGFAQIVMTLNSEFLPSANADGNWTRSLPETFPPFYAASSMPTGSDATSSLAAEELVPVYVYKTVEPTDTPGLNKNYAYSLEAPTEVTSEVSECWQAASPVALDAESEEAIAFYAYNTQLPGTVPIYGYRWGVNRGVYCFSSAAAVEDYGRSAFPPNSNTKTGLAKVAFYAYPVIADG